MNYFVKHNITSLTAKTSDGYEVYAVNPRC